MSAMTTGELTDSRIPWTVPCGTATGEETTVYLPQGMVDVCKLYGSSSSSEKKKSRRNSKKKKKKRKARPDSIALERRQIVANAARMRRLAALGGDIPERNSASYTQKTRSSLRPAHAVPQAASLALCYGKSVHEIEEETKKLLQKSRTLAGLEM